MGRIYLLPEHGTFYKANLHCHSTVSDGHYTPEELKQRYMAHGYSIIAYTDHDVMIPHHDLADEDFLPLTGYEMEVFEYFPVPEQPPQRFRKQCHMCLIALDPDKTEQVCFHRSRFVWGNAKTYLDQIHYDETEPDYMRVYNHECISDMMKRGRNNGFFVTWNHPGWSMENYSDYIGYEHMHAMEICNYSGTVMGYSDNHNGKEYDDMLRAGKRIFCIAADDNHNLHPEADDSFGGFTMIKADKLEYKTITDALLSGHFYASEAPLIHSLWFEDGEVHITCSDAKRITMHTGVRRNRSAHPPQGATVNEAVFQVDPTDGYVRFTVTDEYGRKASTNAFFTDELFG